MRQIRYSVTAAEDSGLFETIVRLVEQCDNISHVTVDDGYEGKEIHYTPENEDVEYVYTMGYSHEAAAVTMTLDSASGAAWFRQMRGEQIPDAVRAQNKWNDLITQIAQDFYKRNPLLVYCDTKSSFAGRADQQADNIRRIIRTFYPYTDQDITIGASKTQETKKIYAASMRLLLRVSAGAPTPVLGRLYFTVDDNQNMVFLDKDDAQQVEDQLFHGQSSQTVGAVAGGTSGHASRGTSASGNAAGNAAAALAQSVVLENATFDVLRDLLKNHEHLEEKILFNDETKPVIAKLTDALRREHRDGDVEVEITKIEVNTYFVISVNVASFDVKFRGCDTDAFRATVLFNRISLRCLGCRSNNDIMNDNCIHYVDENGVAHVVKLVFQGDDICFVEGAREVHPDDEDYADMAQNLKRYVFDNHMQRVSCSLCFGTRVCTRYVCKEMQIAVQTKADGSRSEIKCANCLYPETYIVLEGKAYSPRLLFFDADKRRIRFGSVGRCMCCDREIDGKKQSGCCKLCESVLYPNEEEKGAQRKLYRAYRGLLPLSARLFRTGSRCAEDQSLIVMQVGHTTYSFDKLNGYLTGFNNKDNRHKRKGKR